MRKVKSWLLLEFEINTINGLVRWGVFSPFSNSGTQGIQTQSAMAFVCNVNVSATFSFTKFGVPGKLAGVPSGTGATTPEAKGTVSSVFELVASEVF